MALAPNWEDQDTATCIIINYFADRHHTEIILKKQECLTAETCSYCKECKTAPKLKLTEKNSKKKKKKVSGHLIRTLDIGTFTIQIGAIEMTFFSLKPLRRFTWK